MYADVKSRPSASVQARSGHKRLSTSLSIRLTIPRIALTVETCDARDGGGARAAMNVVASKKHSMIPLSDAQTSLIAAEAVEILLGVAMAMQMRRQRTRLRLEDFIADNAERQLRDSTWLFVLQQRVVGVETSPTSRLTMMAMLFSIVTAYCCSLAQAFNIRLVILEPMYTILNGCRKTVGSLVIFFTRTSIQTFSPSSSTSCSPSLPGRRICWQNAAIAFRPRTDQAKNNNNQHQVRRQHHYFYSSDSYDAVKKDDDEKRPTSICN